MNDEIDFKDWVDRRAGDIKTLGDKSKSSTDFILAVIANILMQIAIELHNKFRPEVK